MNKTYLPFFKLDFVIEKNGKVLAFKRKRRRIRYINFYKNYAISAENSFVRTDVVKLLHEKCKD